MALSIVTYSGKNSNSDSKNTVRIKSITANCPESESSPLNVIAIEHLNDGEASKVSNEGKVCRTTAFSMCSEISCDIHDTEDPEI